MILIFILAVQSRWLLILNPHHHCTILTVSGNLKAKIRFSNKWFFKNILLRKQQWENYTKISANPIINSTTALSLHKSREKNVYNCLFWRKVYLCMLISRLWDTDHLSAWSARPPVTSLASRFIDQCPALNTFTVHISQTLSHLQLPTRFKSVFWLKYL